MPIEPGTFLGPYEILAPLGSGGMGEVYRARDTKLRREVALKVLPEAFSQEPDRLARFQREAELLATLNHPNIAAVYGFEESNPSTSSGLAAGAIVLELVEGETLAERIARGPVPLEEALPIARQIADALEAAHERGVIHRDLKPANIKITPDGRVKVLDFGLAKLLEADGRVSSVSMSPTLSVAATRAGVILGTAAYMSPEQARGKPLDRRTDIWSFGCVLFEMLAGRQVFESGDTVSDAVAAILKTDPDWKALPAETPPHIRKLLRRCLEKDPQRRLPHIGVARLDIDEPVEAPAGTQPATDLSAALRAERRRSRLGWIAAALLLVSTLALTALVLWLRTPAPARSVRFVITAPEGARFGHNMPQRGAGPAALHMAPSPDGTRLAYVMFTTGKPQLWVRRLDALSGQPLPGTDDAAFPFWSADGRFIAFFAEGKLKKIDAGGGPPQSLCDAPAGEGGTWNRDGDIVFAPDVNGTLFRVSAAGGRPTPVTKLDTELREVSHRWPQFLPDGRRFLYVATIGRGPATQTSLYAGSLDAPERTSVLPGSLRAVYASGHLLLVRENTLMAQAFDPRSLQLSGEPIPIAEDVAMNPAGGRTGFAASESGALIYRTGAPASGQREIVWVDRTGTRVAGVGQPGEHLGQLRLSPDGQRATVSMPNTTSLDSQDLWVLDLARGGVPQRLTFTPEQTTAAPTWSPDGTRILFAAGAREQLGIFQKSASGGGDVESFYTPGKSALRPASWSSDGKTLLYAVGDPGAADVWALPLVGERKPYAVISTSFNEYGAQFSPDSKWIAYGSNKGGAQDVYVRAFQGDWERRISADGGAGPRWRRDGQELFYVTSQAGSMMAVAIKPGEPLEIGPPQKLFDVRLSGGVPGQWDVSADGQQFLIIQRIAQPQSEASELTVVLNWNAALNK